MENETNQDLKETIVIDSTAPGQAVNEPVEEVKTESAEAKVEEAKVDTEEVLEALPKWAQDKIRKTEEEKENYKKGMLKYYKQRTLEPEKKEETDSAEIAVEETPAWDENSLKFQKQTLSEAKRIAEQQAREIISKASEKNAISSFISQHPELEDEAKWSEVISNYYPKNGKESVNDILKDLDRAYYLTRYEKGEVGTAKKDGKEKDVASMASVAKTTSKSVKESSTLSEGAARIAQRMRVDMNKLAKEDDSLTAEIHL